MMYEVPLYSDTMVVGEPRHLGPYDLLNAVSPQTPEHEVDVSIFARVRLHGEHWSHAPIVASDEPTSRYHGGTHDEELAALLALFLGIRLKAGAPTRMFFGRDPLGRPQADQRRPVARLRPLHGKPVLELPRHGPNLDEAGRCLQTFMQLQPAHSVAFAKSARLYQEAVWVAESDPERAWLALIHSVETAAVQEQQGQDDPVAVLWRVRKKLAKLLSKDDELLKKVAKQLSRMFEATNRFVSFLLKYCPDPPEKRPPLGAGRLEWTAEALTVVFSTLYDARSRAPHDGTGFPNPLCSPPIKLPDWEAPEERPCALGYSYLGTTWEPEEVPATLRAFHHVVRGALMNWLSGTSGPLAP
jgi:hypothetical protein